MLPVEGIIQWWLFLLMNMAEERLAGSVELFEVKGAELFEVKGGPM